MVDVVWEFGNVADVVVPSSQTSRLSLAPVTADGPGQEPIDQKIFDSFNPAKCHSDIACIVNKYMYRFLHSYHFLTHHRIFYFLLYFYQASLFTCRLKETDFRSFVTSKGVRDRASRFYTTENVLCKESWKDVKPHHRNSNQGFSAYQANALTTALVGIPVVQLDTFSTWLPKCIF